MEKILVLLLCVLAICHPIHSNLHGSYAINNFDPHGMLQFVVHPLGRPGHSLISFLIFPPNQTMHHAAFYVCDGNVESIKQHVAMTIGFNDRTQKTLMFGQGLNYISIDAYGMVELDIFVVLPYEDIPSGHPIGTIGFEMHCDAKDEDACKKLTKSYCV